MRLYRIAGLLVEMEPKYPTLQKQARLYQLSEEEQHDNQATPDIIISLTQEYLEQKQKENPHLSLDECEYIWTGSEFYYAYIDYIGLLLHSSAVVVHEKAYLFSAPSGTGKSTHTSLWLDHFGEQAYILNDDKPAIRYRDDKFYACGTPWSGKTDLNRNEMVPLQGITFLERAETNWIRRIDAREGLILLLNQTLRPYEEERMKKLFYVLDKLFCQIPVYRMGCNISDEAVQVAYDTMSKGVIQHED
ncbi:MAG: hypothetical protein ACI4CT_01080 [Lachnospiraceae bacterium]